MRRIVFIAGIVLWIAPHALRAQHQPNKPSYGDVYCSGMTTNQRVPQGTFLVTGEGPNSKSPFRMGATCT